MQAIQFRNVQIPVVTQADGSQWVSVRHVCEALGVLYSGQHTKLSSGQEFNCSVIWTVGTDDKNREMFCIAAQHAHLWIAGISSAKVSESIREQFIAYKHECADAIYRHFNNTGHDFLGLAQQMAQGFGALNEKLDNLIGATDAIFGDEKDDINSLVQQVAQMYKVDGRTVWGWVQTECDVGSYKKQNMKVKNFLLNKLGKGIRLVKEEGV